MRSKGRKNILSMKHHLIIFTSGKAGIRDLLYFKYDRNVVNMLTFTMFVPHYNTLPIPYTILYGIHIYPLFPLIYKKLTYHIQNCK